MNQALKNDRPRTAADVTEHLLNGGSDSLCKLLDENIPPNCLILAAEKIQATNDLLSTRLLAHAAYIQRKYHFSIKAFTTVSESLTSDSMPVTDLLAWAQSLRAECSYEDALSILDRALKTRKLESKLLLERAINLYFLKDYRSALQAAKTASVYNSKTSNKLPGRTLDWMITYLETSLGDAPTGDAFSKRALTHRYASRHEAKTADVLLGVFDYKSPEFSKSSMNIGDYIQSVAMMRHIARRNPSNITFDDPALVDSYNELAQTWSTKEKRSSNKSAHLVILDRDTQHDNYQDIEKRPIWTIVYGWFFHQAFGNGSPFPLQDNIRPVILSFYLQRADDLTAEAQKYLKQYAPIGCRDWSTCYWLLNQGIEAFFSGCLTLTLDMEKPKSRSGEYYVDSPNSDVENGAVSIGQNEPQYRPLQFSQAISESMDLLRSYNCAEKITTSRLHCYLPSLALGSPVTFVPKNHADRRFDGLDNPDRLFAKEIRPRITDLLDTMFEHILDGGTEAQIAAAWQQATQQYVIEAKNKLLQSPLLFENSEKQYTTNAHPTLSSLPEAVCIAMAFDKQLYNHSFTTIRSILRNTHAQIDFKLLLRGIDDSQASAFSAAFPQANFDIIAMDGLLENADIQLASNTTISTMDRLFLPKLLPDHDRVVYIDVDTIVEGDIAELARYTPSKRGIAACPTPNPYHNLQVHWIERSIERRKYETAKAREYRRTTAAQVDLLAPYFNAGVLLLSLETLRQLDFTNSVTKVVGQYGLEDQEALNLFSLGHYTHLPASWNAQPYTSWFDSANLIHWPGTAKPWLNNRHIRYADCWDRYESTHNSVDTLSTQDSTTPNSGEAKPTSADDGLTLWKQSDAYVPGWSSRAEMAAQWLPKKGAIADIGCGALFSLKPFLDPAVQHVPADVVAWTPEVTEINLNNGDFPEGNFEAVVMLGVLEYLPKPAIALRLAHKRSSQLITSYCHPHGSNAHAIREERHWVNAFQEKGFERLLLRVGWRIIDRELYVETDNMRQVLYHCERCSPVLPPKLGPLATRVRQEQLTYLRPEKMARLESALERISSAQISGAFCEFGIALGGSAIVIADCAKKHRQKFIGLDVFDTIPKPESVNDGQDARSRFDIIASGRSKGIGDNTYYGYREDLYSDVKAAFENYDLSVDGESINLVKGKFTETWPTLKNPIVAFAHIDCDWYDPVKYCLNAMLPTLAPGGIIVMDDYHDYSGARIATDEFLLENPQFTMEDGPNPIIVRNN